jgi:hypothetical protein
MTRKGYRNISLNEGTYRELVYIKRKNNLGTIPETIRYICRELKRGDQHV